MGNRGKAMGMNSDLSTPPEYVVNHSGRALLGSLPLIRGEDGCAYNELCARIAAAVKPKDFISISRSAVLRRDSALIIVRSMRSRASLIATKTSAVTDSTVRPVAERNSSTRATTLGSPNSADSFALPKSAKSFVKS